MVDFYEMTGEQLFLEAGKRIADELVKHQRDGDAAHSPWPFRVDVRDGQVIEEYSAHMIPAVRLFDELIRLGETQYQSSRDQVVGLAGGLSDAEQYLEGSFRGYPPGPG